MEIPNFISDTGTPLKKMSLIFSTVVLTACTNPVPVTHANTKQTPYVHVPRTYVSISCVSHEGAPYISDFAIEEPIVSGRLGARMAYGASCGGMIAASYALPETWTPGMKVRVRWKPNGREWMEKTTHIMRYGSVGNIYVHFFEHDEVRVVAANANGASPHHPILSDVTTAPPEDQ